MDRAAFEALARTLHLDELELGASATLARGTLVAPRDTQDGASLGPAPRELPPLPRMIVHRGEGDAPSDADVALAGRLGAGGMGVVWLARQRSLDRDVAVKRLHEDALSASSVGALLVEARATGALEHPSIVPVHALGVDADGSPLLLMKRIEGCTLEELLEDAAHPSWPELEQRYGDRISAYVEVLARVADALHFAHTRGFVHRDVKPANVMVGGFGEVYLLDWGLALRPDALTPLERTTLSIVGTPGFMAPEMIAGRAEHIDARTDVYLLGGTLHALLTGQPRHQGESLRAIMASAVLSAPYEYDARVPPELGALANRATAGDRELRPRSAAAFREALMAFLRHRGSQRLSDDAMLRLDALRGRVSLDGARRTQDPDAAAALVECRFAFTQALQEWPANVPARQGLRASLLLMVDAELRRRSPDAAAELARQLDPPEPGLETRIEEVRASVAESRRFEDAARRDVRERDHRVGARVGVVIQSGLILAIAAVSLAGMRADMTAAESVPASVIVWWASALLVLSCVTLAATRKVSLANRWGRQMSFFLLVVLGAIASSAGTVAFRGGSVWEAAPISMNALAAVLAGGAVGLDRRLGWSAAASLLAALLCAVWPAITPIAMGLAGVVAVAVFLPESIRNAREQRRVTRSDEEKRRVDG